MTWLGKVATLDEVSSLLPRRWDVPQIFRDRLGESAGRQRVMLAEGHALLILHSVPDAEGHREGAFFWRNPEGKWKQSEGSSGHEALRAHWRAFLTTIDGLEQRLDKADSARALFEILRVCAPLERTSRNGAAVMQQAREALPEDRGLITLRDLAQEAAREAELLHNEAKAALDYMIARQGEAQAAHGMQIARLGHRINLLAALFLPMTALTSIFGMNLSSGLEPMGPSMFWIVLGVGLLLGIIVGCKVVTPPNDPDQ